MKTFISIENHKAEQFEQTLEEFDFLDQLQGVSERDFMTDFLFEDLTEEEESELETLKKGLN